jgi:hypothetical protein
MRVLLASAAMAAALCAPALADPLGVWTVRSESAAGPSVSTMTVTQTDGAYALTYESSAGASTISDLNIDGDHVMFVRTLTSVQLGSDIVLNYDITIDGDALTGTATADGDASALLGGPIALQGTRNAE